MLDNQEEQVGGDLEVTQSVNAVPLHVWNCFGLKIEALMPKSNVLYILMHPRLAACFHFTRFMGNGNFRSRTFGVGLRLEILTSQMQAPGRNAHMFHIKLNSLHMPW